MGRGTSRFGLSEDERWFLDASRERVDRERVARSRRRRRVTVVLAAAAVAAMALAAVAFVQRRNADRQADERRSGELAGLATLAIDDDPERAILLPSPPWRGRDEPSSEVLSALHRATQSTRLTRAIGGVVTGSMDLSPTDPWSPSTAWTEPATSSSTPPPARPSPTSRRAPRSAGRMRWRSMRAAPPWPSPSQHRGWPGILDRALRRGLESTSEMLTGGRTTTTAASIQFDPTGRWFGALGGERPARWCGTCQRRRGEVVRPGTTSSPARRHIDHRLWSGDGLAISTSPRAADPSDRDAGGRGVRVRARPDRQARRTRLRSSRGMCRRHRHGLRRGSTDARVPRPDFAQFSRDGRRLAVAGNDGLILLYDTDDFVEQERLEGTSGGRSGSPSLRTGPVSCQRKNGEVRIWDVSPSVGLISATSTWRAGSSTASRWRRTNTAYATTYTNFGDIELGPPSRHRQRRGRRGARRRPLLLLDPPARQSRPLGGRDARPDFVTSVVQLPAGARRDRDLRVRPCVRSERSRGRGRRHVGVPGAGTGPGGASRIVDLRTGDTLLDVPDTVIYAATSARPGMMVPAPGGSRGPRFQHRDAVRPRHRRCRRDVRLRTPTVTRPRDVTGRRTSRAVDGQRQLSSWTWTAWWTARSGRRDHRRHRRPQLRQQGSRRLEQRADRHGVVGRRRAPLVPHRRARRQRADGPG